VGQDRGGTNHNAEPVFGDVGSYDYHLDASSPCIDRANLDVAPYDDFEGDERRGDDDPNPDEGADEVLF